MAEINTAEQSLAALKEQVARLEAEAQKKLSSAGQTFVTQILRDNPVKRGATSKTTGKESTWVGCRVAGIPFEVDGKQYTATITVTDKAASDALVALAKAEEQAAKEREKAEKEYGSLQAKLAALREQAGLDPEAEAA